MKRLLILAYWRICWVCGKLELAQPLPGIARIEWNKILRGQPTATNVNAVYMARSCLQGDLSSGVTEKVSRPEILKGPAIVFKGLSRLPGLRQTYQAHCIAMSCGMVHGFKESVGDADLQAWAAHIPGFILLCPWYWGVHVKCSGNGSRAIFTRAHVQKNSNRDFFFNAFLLLSNTPQLRLQHWKLAL